MTNQAVEALHETQYEILTAIWASCEAHGDDSENRNKLNRRYDETIVSLLAILGEHAPAANIDLAQYEIFSNLFKDENGVRPNGYTYAAMAAWMDNRKVVLS